MRNCTNCEYYRYIRKEFYGLLENNIRTVVPVCEIDFTAEDNFLFIDINDNYICLRIDFCERDVSVSPRTKDSARELAYEVAEKLEDLFGYYKQF